MIFSKHKLQLTQKNVQTNIVNICNEHAPLKRRYVCENQAPFMNKTLIKEIMTRFRLRNKFLKPKNDANRKAYNCVSVFCREKKSFFSNLDTLRLLIINVSGKLLSLSFQIKIRVKNKITLVEDKTKIVSDNNLVSRKFNNFFANIVPSLGLQCKDDLLNSVQHIESPLEKHN